MKNEDPDPDPHCCCEYTNYKGERSHILTCCCDCTEFDQFCETLINCRPTSESAHKMLIALQDRLRCPFPGGARNISSLLPLLLVVASQLIAAIHLYCSIIVFTLMPFLLLYARVNSARVNPRTAFFCLWCAWSVVYLLVLFEFSVPLMEFLPEENYTFMALLSITLFCFYRVHARSSQRIFPVVHVPLKASDEQTVLVMPEVPADEQEEGCFEIWVGAVISRLNLRWYIAGCSFALVTLLLFANLTLTSICHPFQLFKLLSVNILLPDDCSDAYEQYDIALCFVGAIYAMLLAIFVLVKLMQQICLITNGVSLADYRRGERTNRKSCLANWRAFLCD